MNPPDKKRKFCSLLSDDQDEPRKVSRNLFTEDMNFGQFSEGKNATGVCMPSKLDKPLEPHLCHEKQYFTGKAASLRSEYNELRFAPVRTKNCMEATGLSIKYDQVCLLN